MGKKKHSDGKTVRVHDRDFRLYISEQKIRKSISSMAEAIEQAYGELNPILLPVLNGSFIFAADLVRELSMNFELAFIKAQSYDAFHSTGDISERIGLELDIRGRHVLLIEDIIDTGNTMAWMLKKLAEKQPASLDIATLLFKPEAYLHDFPIRFVGMEIPDAFVVGYGLDYDGHGRNLKAIYQVC